MPEHLSSRVFDLLDQLVARQAQTCKPVQRLIVAYSGGLDSSVLLHVLHRYVSASLSSLLKRPKLIALHVNHNLQVHAPQWAEHCAFQAEKYGVELHVMNAVIQKSSKQSPEEAAREARYQLFERTIKAGDVLCLAHHQNDQAETLLLRLFRGSGPLGLSAMRRQAELGPAILLRPLLSFSREDLERYAKDRQLSWIDDPSNQDVCFDRNYVRHEIVPRLLPRWPGLNKALSRVADINQDTVQLLNELAEQDYQRAARGASLRITVLQTLSQPRLDNLLRYWLQKQGALLPSRQNLQRIRDELVHLEKVGHAQVRWPDATVRVYQNHLYFVPVLPRVTLGAAVSWRFSQAPETLALGAGRGHLFCETTVGSGLAVGVLEQASHRGDLHVRWRQGGERCHPVGRGHSQSLKKLLQEYHVPPWLRDAFPLLYSADQCLAVPGVWVEKEFAAQAGEVAYALSWSFYTAFERCNEPDER